MTRIPVSCSPAAGERARLVSKHLVSARDCRAPLAKVVAIWYNARCRGVAQPGSAPEWGSGGRPFESGRPDHANQVHFAFRLLGYGRSGGRYPNSLSYR
jgi:hypothetical protein